MPSFLVRGVRIPYRSFADAGLRFAREHMALPVILCVIYLALIYQCSRFMYRPGQQRFDLRYPLAYWNAALSLFSFLGAMRTVPELIYRLGYWAPFPRHDLEEDFVTMEPTGEIVRWKVLE